MRYNGMYLYEINETVYRLVHEIHAVFNTQINNQWLHSSFFNFIFSILVAPLIFFHFFSILIIYSSWKFSWFIFVCRAVPELKRVGSKFQKTSDVKNNGNCFSFKNIFKLCEWNEVSNVRKLISNRNSITIFKKKWLMKRFYCSCIQTYN